MHRGEERRGVKEMKFDGEIRRSLYREIEPCSYLWRDELKTQRTAVSHLCNSELKGPALGFMLGMQLLKGLNWTDSVA